MIIIEENRIRINNSDGLNWNIEEGSIEPELKKGKEKGEMVKNPLAGEIRWTLKGHYPSLQLALFGVLNKLTINNETEISLKEVIAEINKAKDFITKALPHTIS